MPDGSGVAKDVAKKAASLKKRRFNKNKLPSRHTTVGPERAPHRSYLYAMGLTEKEINQPLVGIATCWNEAAPCNISLSRQAQAAKKGGDSTCWRSWSRATRFPDSVIFQRPMKGSFILPASWR